MGKQRPRITRYGTFTPKAQKQHEMELFLKAGYNGEPFTGPIFVQVDFYFRRPKSVSKSRKYPTVKPDIDNVLKSIGDAFNGVLWEDDKLIVALASTKQYANEDYILLHVEDYQ